jgi:hypothetical protein
MDLMIFLALTNEETQIIISTKITINQPLNQQRNMLALVQIPTSERNHRSIKQHMYAHQVLELAVDVLFLGAYFL